MKKLFSLIFLICLAIVSMAQIATPRFGTTPNSDNTGRVTTFGVIGKTYSTTVSVTPNSYETFVNVATLTGDATINAVTTVTHKYDQMNVLLASDTSTRTVTLGTGFATTLGTLAITPSTKAYLKFIFDGTAWIELTR
jgi:hypothetical protein